MPKHAVRHAENIFVAEYSEQLWNTIKQAIDVCAGAPFEEKGGVIIVSPGGIYKFIQLINTHSGTSAAVACYEASRNDYGALVIPLFNEGYKNYASFHTHPKGCSASASSTDLTRLFNGFPVNYIWSETYQCLNRYTFVESEGIPTYIWKCNSLYLKNLNS